MANPNQELMPHQLFLWLNRESELQFRTRGCSVYACRTLLLICLKSSLPRTSVLIGVTTKTQNTHAAGKGKESECPACMGNYPSGFSKVT